MECLRFQVRLPGWGPVEISEVSVLTFKLPSLAQTNYIILVGIKKNINKNMIYISLHSYIYYYN